VRLKDCSGVPKLTDDRTNPSSAAVVKPAPDRPPAPPATRVAGIGARIRKAFLPSHPPAEDSRSDGFAELFGVFPLQGVVDHLSEALIICDDDGEVLMINAAAAALLGVLQTQIVARSLAKLLSQTAPTSGRVFFLHTGEAELMLPPAAPRPVNVRVNSIDFAGRRCWLVSPRERSDEERARERLNYLAHYDSLTSLPNRMLFRDRLASAMARSQRSGNPMALMFLDIDRFKLINDSLGHEVGDLLLKQVATRLTACLRDVDSVSRVSDADPFTISRLGGDEFTVIAEDIRGVDDAALIASRMIEALSVPATIAGHEIVSSASIGISMYPADNVDLETLIHHTDMAMYRSKSMGRSTFSFYSDDLNAAATARLAIEEALRHALERNEFQLHFQPKACLNTGRITGVEALLRWHCPGLGMVPPDRFIPVLEDTGLILPVGAWVIRTACAQLGVWDALGLPALRMAVNVSARQFRDPRLAALVRDTLREHEIDPRRLEIEMTESLLMEDTSTTRSMFESFDAMGVRMAIDDFGTGHSSLSYLKRFNIDTLKIDKSFVQALPGNAEDLAISTAVIAMARSMNMSVVAEGVETAEQAQTLRELKCDEIQGYLLSRPLPASDLARWLEERIRQETLRRATYNQRSAEPLEPMSLNLARDTVFGM
jgi:diguanylate cyclase (GGDEF)-like protein